MAGKQAMTGFTQPSHAAGETELLFAECRDSLIRYLRHHLDDATEAEDIAQESFVRFFQARGRDEEIRQPRAWLFRVAHNLLIDQGRKRRPDLLDEQAWINVEGRFASPLKSIEAGVYLAQLPWRQLSPMELECLRLRSEGLKFREIGEVLNLSISTVVSYISRAVKKLRATEAETREAPEHRRNPTAV